MTRISISPPIWRSKSFHPATPSAEIARKIGLYLLHGSSEVWVVRPRERDIAVHRADATKAVFRADETLTSPLFPGKGLALSRVFPPR